MKMYSGAESHHTPDHWLQKILEIIVKDSKQVIVCTHPGATAQVFNNFKPFLGGTPKPWIYSSVTVGTIGGNVDEK